MGDAFPVRFAGGGPGRKPPRPRLPDAVLPWPPSSRCGNGLAGMEKICRREESPAGMKITVRG
ncbi:MAG TPA: hypothetical protein PLH54_06330 [Syntrophales bacterium]|nr:hypothetical protein [Syntrophales bacterium]HPC32566.1 hypothetical protein [Syntrophales bacterium]HRU88649.1 hypothetical protein [Syntrophales bacterium]